jgi:manganese-dependent inorganic pyrophosphatase
MKPILVTCYTNPDLDGFACALAYSEFLNKTKQNALPGIFGRPHDEVKYLVSKFNLKYPSSADNRLEFGGVVMVDASEVHALAKDFKPEDVIEVIDHRKINDAKLFVNAKIQIELVGAAATLIAEKFQSSEVVMSKQSGVLLYGAIISNTLNFKASVTTDRDLKMAEWLKEKFNFSNGFASEMFLAKSDLTRDKLRDRLSGDMAIKEDLAIGQIEMIGANKLVEGRKPEILKELREIKSRSKSSMIFLSIIELEDNFNLFITEDPKVQKMLKEIFRIKFEDNVAKREGLIMRKEIMPKVMEYRQKFGV